MNSKRRKDKIRRIKMDLHELDTQQRSFDTGAIRDNDTGKLDFVRALSPIVLSRFVYYMDKHRDLPDGTKREFDNWKEGIPKGTSLSSLGRHFIDVWKLMHEYSAEDNHGKVDLEDALCGVIFNAQSILFELLKEAKYGK